MEFRELGPEHEDDVIDLWERCGLTRAWNPPAIDFRRAVTGASSAVLGAFDADGALVGSAMVGDDGHRGWVYYVAVEPEARRRGLGRDVVDAAERWLRVRGVRKMELMVRDEQPSAADFYEALGFRAEEVTVFSKWLVGKDTDRA